MLSVIILSLKSAMECWGSKPGSLVITEAPLGRHNILAVEIRIGIRVIPNTKEYQTGLICAVYYLHDCISSPNRDVPTTKKLLKVSKMSSMMEAMDQVGAQF